MTTIADVARQAGVSVSTVSYALSGARPIRPETRARIEAAMAELGYRPNASARSLASRRSSVLSLVYPEVDRGVGGTGGEFIHAAAERARELGYQLVLWPFRASDAEQVGDLARQRMADGVLIMEVLLDDPRIEVLEAAAVPYVMIGRTREVENRASVDIDFEATLAESVRRLAELGHRRIAFINHSEESFRAGYGPTVRAAAAFDRAIAAHGLSGWSRTCEDSPLAGRLRAAELLQPDTAPTAFLTMNELATFGVLAELQHRDLVVPRDVSVLGIVTSPGVSAMSYPPLTTMNAPGAELGRAAVDHLVALLNPAAERPLNRLVPCQFGNGKSIGPVRTETGAESERR